MDAENPSAEDRLFSLALSGLPSGRYGHRSHSPSVALIPIFVMGIFVVAFEGTDQADCDDSANNRRPASLILRLAAIPGSLNWSRGPDRMKLGTRMSLFMRYDF